MQQTDFTFDMAMAAFVHDLFLKKFHHLNKPKSESFVLIASCRINWTIKFTVFLTEARQMIRRSTWRREL